jgi:hypothetical protein
MADQQIQQCNEVLDQGEREYVDEDRYTLISVTPEKIMQTAAMALWAHCKAGEKKVDMQMPSLRAWLRTLAANGPGWAETYQGVEYRFVSRKLPLSPKFTARILTVSTEDPAESSSNISS